MLTCTSEERFTGSIKQTKKQDAALAEEIAKNIETDGPKFVMFEARVMIMVRIFQHSCQKNACSRFDMYSSSMRHFT
jgi:hypothetical protein